MEDKQKWVAELISKIDSMSREEFIASLDKAGFFKDKGLPLPNYGELLTRAEYEDFGSEYDSCFASDGKVYWDIDPEVKDSSHVWCLSK